jgi:hypothetical protein
MVPTGPAVTKWRLRISDDRRAVSVVAIVRPDAAARRARRPVAQPRKPMAEFARWDRL